MTRLTADATAFKPARQPARIGSGLQRERPRPLLPPTLSTVQVYIYGIVIRVALQLPTFAFENKQGARTFIPLEASVATQTLTFTNTVIDTM